MAFYSCSMWTSISLAIFCSIISFIWSAESVHTRHMCALGVCVCMDRNCHCYCLFCLVQLPYHNVCRCRHWSLIIAVNFVHYRGYTNITTNHNHFSMNLPIFWFNIKTGPCYCPAHTDLHTSASDPARSITDHNIFDIIHNHQQCSYDDGASNNKENSDVRCKNEKRS